VADPLKTVSSVADANPMPLEADDIADCELASTSTIDLAVHRDEPVGDDLFDISSGVEKTRELEELAEANIIPADGNVFDRSGTHHHFPMLSAVRRPSA